MRRFAKRSTWVVLVVFFVLYLAVGFWDGIRLVTHPRYGFLFIPWINATYWLEWTPLMVAARDNNYEQVKNLLKRRADTHRTDLLGMTALHFAAENGNQRIATLLLDAGSPINAKDRSGASPLASALSYGHFSFAIWLHRQGGVGVPELHFAAATGNLQEIERLLSDVAIDIAQVDANGFTALHYAAWQGETAIVKKLVEAGIPPDARTWGTSGSGVSPIHLAAEQGHSETLQYLLAVCNRPNIKDSSNRTPLHYAARDRKGSDTFDAMVVLLESGADADGLPSNSEMEETPLELVTTYRADLKYIDLLIDYGASLEPRPSDGMTPLHQLLRRGRNPDIPEAEFIAVAKHLIEKGVDPNARDSAGRKASQLADSREVMLVLEEAETRATKR